MRFSPKLGHCHLSSFTFPSEPFHYTKSKSSFRKFSGSIVLHTLFLLAVIWMLYATLRNILKPKSQLYILESKELTQPSATFESQQSRFLSSLFSIGDVCMSTLLSHTRAWLASSASATHTIVTGTMLSLVSYVFTWNVEYTIGQYAWYRCICARPKLSPSFSLALPSLFHNT
jgi:hypothetical protein